jgi:predicted solute-binding protein
MLYGHIETLEERLEHMMRLRETQDETGGFLTFIPLAFQPGNTGIKPSNRYTSAIDDLKTIAISRLMLDNFPHIKAYWVMLTEEVASVALNFGADDMDGTVGGEKIAHDAGAISPMAMKKDQLIRIIRDAGKIPVERDVYYNPIRIHTDHVIGKIPYLNSIAYHAYLDVPDYKILPVRPRRMGMLSEQGMIDAGLFSVMNYVHQADRLDLLGYGLASRDQVKSVMLFSKEGWRDLDGKRIAIIDDTATSVQLLRVLLQKRYGVAARFERLHGGVNDLTGFDAVLLIGDEALQANKNGLPGFDLVYDLAREWYDWQKLPFVFAVWAVKKSMSQEDRARLTDALVASREKSAENYAAVGGVLGRRIGLSDAETAEYLDGFNYSLGEREREAIARFAALVEEEEQSRVKR